MIAAAEVREQAREWSLREHVVEKHYVLVSYRRPPQRRGDPPRSKLDLTADEVLVQDATPRRVAHPFMDRLQDDAIVHCYSLTARGERVRVLEGWCPPFDGFFLYYPSRRHQPPALHAVVGALRV
jgi:hypothetical protein